MGSKDQRDVIDLIVLHAATVLPAPDTNSPLLKNSAPHKHLLPCEVVLLKGQSHEVFDLRFCHQTVLLSGTLRRF